MRQGIGLIELLVSMTVMTVAFGGILSLVSTSLHSSRTVSDQYVASFLALEGVEIVKNMVDWNIVNGERFDCDFTDGNYAVDYTDIDPSGSNCGGQVLSNAPTENQRKLYLLNGRYQHGSGGGAVETPFQRLVQAESIGGTADALLVTVSVTSTATGVNTTIEDVFFNWRP